MNLLYQNRSEEDKNLIKEVCNYIISEPLEAKEINNNFAAIFVEGRNREINTLEDFSSLYSFRRFSKYKYPIFCFLKNHNKFLLSNVGNVLNKELYSNIHVIQIPEINSLEEYSKFCIEKLYYLLPSWVENVVTLQPDGMLLKSGWEDYVLNSKCDWLSPHWKHLASVDIFDLDKWKSFRWRTPIGNGGFSFRKASKIREITKEFGHLITRESGRDDNRPPMEDLWYCYLGFLNRIMRIPTLKQCDDFAVDPLTLDIWNNKANLPYGFHYFRTISEFPPCNHG